LNAIVEPVSKFDFHHGGLCIRTPNLIYIEGEMTSCYLDADKISVDDLKAEVVDMGYGEHRVRKLHLKKPNMIFEQALLPIENDEHVHYLIELLMNEPFVSIYVEYEDEDNCKNMSNVVVVGPVVDDDVLKGGGLEELDISLSNPNFELLSDDDDVQSKNDDEDISLLQKQ